MIIEYYKEQKIIYLWLFALTCLYLYWPTIESETVRNKIEKSNERISGIEDKISSPDYGKPENKKWIKSGKWMRKIH